MSSSDNWMKMRAYGQYPGELWGKVLSARGQEAAASPSEHEFQSNPGTVVKPPEIKKFGEG